MKQTKMVKQMKMMKQIKMIFIIIFSTALFGCSGNNDMNISNLMGWGKETSTQKDTSIFTSIPPNLIETDGSGTNNPTEIKFVITGTAVKNCDIQNIATKAGESWGPFLVKGETTITGTTYSSDFDSSSNFLLFGDCSEDSTATVSVEYTVGTKKYSGTTQTKTIPKGTTPP